MEKTTFLMVFSKYIEYYKSPVNQMEKKAPVTIQGYCNKYSVIYEYLKSENTLYIKAEDFKVPFARKMFNILNLKYKHNYAARIVDMCSTVMDFGVNEGLLRFNPLGSFTILKEPPKKPTYFTPDQISLWEKYRSNSTIKQKAADLFTLIMHTGFDYGDLFEVGRQHVVSYKSVRYLIKPRHKNGNEAVIPLSRMAESLLEKYDYKMRILSNPKLNEAIKEVARELGINIHLTVKSGRKIFMMDKLNNEGYSMEATSKMGGHKSVKTTETTYAHVNIARVHSEIQEHKQNFNYI